MNESEPVVRPGDRLVDLNRLIEDALLPARFGLRPSVAEVAAVREVVSVLLEGRDERVAFAEAQAAERTWPAVADRRGRSA